MANGGNQAPLSGRDHVVIFPFMAKGHTLPLLHFATAPLSLYHDALRVTLITTPANCAFAHRHLPKSVDLVELPFPSLPPLPAGVESTDALPCASMYSTFLHATALLREPFADFLASLPSPPLVLVSDFFLGFTHRVAGDAGVRRIVFHGMSCSTFQVPGMPEHVAITAEEVPESVRKWVCDDGHEDGPVTRFIVDDIGDSDACSWGVLVNSFAALEQDYVSALESFYYQPGAQAWLVGPLFLAAGGMSSELEDPDGCLPAMARPKSVAAGAVGGFVSHGGWNSVSESLAAGKPILVWPMIAEQPLNARHIVDMIGAGDRVDVKAGTAASSVVEREMVEEKVRTLMDADGEVGKRVRLRAESCRKRRGRL
ncbi:hypothetical protein HU200_021779 [Digitaria exilis]|uniref:Glycosyltransferase N-terminal domain-containing protein n=1 Tax=Digitaria exilis TaxID=1010633 RepID=A0A835EYU0_9POAL|nr:hypothetical protein HU200_021779 [Digitaria exilis]